MFFRLMKSLGKGMIGSHKWAIPVSLFALAVLVSATNLPGAEFVWDDSYVIQSNPAIRNLQSLPSYFTTTWAAGTDDARGRGKNASFYRPIPTLSYAIDYALWGESPVMFRLGNGLLHGATTVLLFLLLVLLGISTMGAAMGAALFAVHPVHTEVIAVLAYRTSLLAIMFYLAALAVHCRWNSDKTAGNIAVPVLVALALLSKESAATVPAALVFMDLAMHRRFTFKHVLVRYLPVVLIFGCYMLIRATLVQSATGSPFAGMGVCVKVLTMLKTMALYARVLLVPWPLCAYYDPSIHGPTADPLAPGVIVGLVLVLGYLFAAAAAWRKSRVVSVLLLMVPLALAPYLHIIPFRAIAGERFLYLPSAPLCGLAGLGLATLAAKARWHRTALAATALLILVFGTVSAVRNQDWRNDRTILGAKIRDYPESFDAHFAMGRYLLDRENRPMEAIPHLKRAVEIWPGFDPAGEMLERARTSPRPP